ADETDTQWLFRISDNGPGVDEPYRIKLFQPFRRGGHHKEQGLGLGLAICRKIVESHGGKIWYESGTETGATFLFTLPKRASELPQKSYFPLEPALPDILPENSNGPALASIMLVEDNDADIELTRIMLI